MQPIPIIAIRYPRCIAPVIGAIGWPLSVIVGGFAVMAVGYLVYRLNERYMKSVQI